MSRRHSYPGACHCRNIEVRLESDKTPGELGVRTDPCSFCNKHQGRYTSDPGGELHIAVRDPSLVQRYRFGTRTADFLICKDCGVFVAATMSEPSLGVVNVNVLDDRADFLESPLPVASLDEESVEERLARRRAKWTPLHMERRSR